MMQTVKARQPVIGIVGGMGPEAGLDLAMKVTAHTRAAKDQDHLPLILHSFPGRIGDRSAFLLGKDSANPGPAILEILLEMERSGVTVAGMACNSAHARPILSVIETGLKKNRSALRLLHIVRETGRHIRENHPGAKRVGILGTTGTWHSGLYGLLKEFDLKVLNVSKDEQELLHTAIYHPEYGIKARAGKADTVGTTTLTTAGTTTLTTAGTTTLTGAGTTGRSTHSLEILVGTARSLIQRGAEVLVLACTEFPLIYHQNELDGVPVTDSSLALAQGLIRAAGQPLF